MAEQLRNSHAEAYASQQIGHHHAYYHLPFTNSDEIKKVEDYIKCIDNCIKKLKDYGYWVVGTDMEGTVYTDIDYKMKTALIIGNEGKGISRLVSENCDYLAKIPMSGTVNSLNASVACGIFLAEINRSRGV